MPAKVTLDVDGILKRIAEAVGAENDHQIAIATGTAQTTISTWRSKRRVPYELCVQVSKAHDVNLAWILFGDAALEAKSNEVDYGLIDINFYEFCWTAADKVHKVDPSIDQKLAALLIYNSMWPHLTSEHSRSGKLTRSQAAMAYHIFDGMGMFDWPKYARELREKLDQNPKFLGTEIRPMRKDNADR